MKKLFAIFGLVLALSSMSVAAFAVVDCFNAQGSAIVSGFTVRYQVGSYTYGYIHITNISNAAVTCRVTVFDEDGVDVTDQFTKVTTGSQPDSGTTTVATGTGTFNIPSKATRVFKIGNNAMDRYMECHALIEWTSTDPNALRALVANFRSLSRYQDAYYADRMPINNGEVF